MNIVRLTKPIPVLSLAALLMLPAISAAIEYYGSDQDRFNDVPDKPEWQEGEVSLPKPPADDGLLEFEVGSLSSGYTFYIDPDSVSVDDDGVSRYTAIVDAGRVRNIFYEGIRCDTDSYKTYAFGAGDGKWKTINKPQWKHIRSQAGPLGFRYDLASRYICQEHSGSYPAEKILEKLRYELKQQFIDDEYRDF